MKITKTEKIWLAAVIIFYICYNLPFVPPYGLAKATLIHALITLVPLWIAIYVGLVKVCRIYRIRDQKTPGDPGTSSLESAGSKCNSDMKSDTSGK
ncbi:MAG: hypothetical protein LIO96_12610 [Lachnospiraceae bacterium]|nr:hypothetical protein [Lachnospiraceae bacterium]